MELSQDGKEELALALLLWKDFKCQGKFSIDFNIQMLKLADGLGVRKGLDELLHKVVFPFKITVG